MLDHLQLKKYIKKICYIYKIEHYPEVKNNDIMKFAGKFKKKILIAISQTHKDNPGMHSLISGY